MIRKVGGNHRNVVLITHCRVSLILFFPFTCPRYYLQTINDAETTCRTAHTRENFSSYDVINLTIRRIIKTTRSNSSNSPFFNFREAPATISFQYGRDNPKRKNHKEPFYGWDARHETTTASAHSNLSGMKQFHKVKLEQTAEKAMAIPLPSASEQLSTLRGRTLWVGLLLRSETTIILLFILLFGGYAFLPQTQQSPSNGNYRSWELLPW